MDEITPKSSTHNTSACLLVTWQVLTVSCMTWAAKIFLWIFDAIYNFRIIEPVSVIFFLSFVMLMSLDISES